jgi:hypothetical protein
LSTHVFKRISEFNSLCNSHTILCDFWRTVWLLYGNVSSLEVGINKLIRSLRTNLWTKSHLDGICDFVHTTCYLVSSVSSKLDVFTVFCSKRSLHNAQEGLYLSHTYV